MATFTGFQLPDITENRLQDEKERRRIIEYLYQLTEQLRYQLNNIDSDNVTVEFIEQVGNSQAVSALKQEVRNAEQGMVSLRKQTAEGFKQTVSKDDIISSINQSAEEITIDADKIKLEGYVTLNGTFSVDEEGYLRCTGGNIGGMAIQNNSIVAGPLVLHADGRITIGTMTLSSPFTGINEMIALTGDMSIGAAGSVYIGGTDAFPMRVTDKAIYVYNRLFRPGIHYYGTAQVTTDSVNMRAGPGTEFGSVAQISSSHGACAVYGAAEDVFGITWYAMQRGQYIGWVSGEYLDLSGIEEMPGGDDSGGGGAGGEAGGGDDNTGSTLDLWVTLNNTPLYDAPGGGVITALSSGTRVDHVDSASNKRTVNNRTYYYVTVQSTGQSGWIDYNFLTD